jgi:hypothetical protein
VEARSATPWPVVTLPNHDFNELFNRCSPKRRGCSARKENRLAGVSRQGIPACFAAAPYPLGSRRH